MEIIRSERSSDRLHLLITFLQREVASMLGLRPTELPEPRQGFFDMGMDSSYDFEPQAAYEVGAGCALPSTVAFDFPNIERLAEFLATSVLNRGDVIPGFATPSRTPHPSRFAPEAITMLSDEEVEMSIERRLEHLEDLVTRR